MIFCRVQRPKTQKSGEIIKTEQYKISYKKQLEIYQWLFRRNGFRVSNTAYFIFANAQKDTETFNDRLDFEKTLIPYEGNDHWIEPAILAIFECLSNDILPESAPECAYCYYRKKIAYHESLN